nr:hypothetical protein L204_03515 [Cryptococcus depauperatus CBS 7855]
MLSTAPPVIIPTATLKAYCHSPLLSSILACILIIAIIHDTYIPYNHQTTRLKDVSCVTSSLLNQVATTIPRHSSRNAIQTQTLLGLDPFHHTLPTLANLDGAAAKI